MNLCIDIGNSRSKVALFQKSQLLKVTSTTVDQLKFVLESAFEKNQAINRVALLASGVIPDILSATLKKYNATVHILDHEWKLPFNNRYRSPKNLGLDRIALVAAASSKYPKKNCLIIDAGTCVTYDFLNYQKDYLGGAISPGLQMRYQAMHEHTASLPHLYPKENPTMIGDTTENSIHSGAVNGLSLEIDGWINHYQSQYEDLTVILTGGDAELLSKSLKNTIFAHSNFLLEGLNYLLEINDV